MKTSMQQMIEEIAIRFSVVVINDYLEAQKQSSKKTLFERLENSTKKTYKTTQIQGFPK